MDTNNKELNNKLIDEIKIKDYEMVEYLLFEKGADANTVTEDGTPVIYVALNNQDILSVEYLLRNDATLDYNQLKKRTGDDDCDGYIEGLMHVAMEVECFQLSKFLINNSDEFKDYNEKVELFIKAFAMQYWDLFEYLSTEFKIDVNDQNKQGETALHYMSKYQEQELIEVLVIEMEANIDIQDSNGSTPLHVAAKNDDTDTFELLVELGARTDIVDKNGETPLDILKRVSKQ